MHDRPVQVRGLQRMPGGASRETYRFELVIGDRVVELVLRRDPPQRPSRPGGMRLEADALSAAGRAGLAVPAVVAASEDEWGSSGIVVGHVDGETIARRILRDEGYAVARSRLVEDCGRFLAGLHAIDPSVVVGLPDGDPLADCRTLYESTGSLRPAFELAFRWLEEHRPAPSGPPAIVHGDFRLGNLIVDVDGLAAVIDWEGVHVGDPLEDLGWLCVRAWRFGAPGRVAGLGDYDELVAAYVANGGRRPDPAALQWWEVFGTLRWGVVCIDQAAAHLDGRVRSVELAAIGRRACEQEWDLLGMLEPEAMAAFLAPARAPSPSPDPAPPLASLPADELHGRPTLDELLEAVQEFLRDDLVPTVDADQQFRVRIAANVVAIARRELSDGGKAAQAHRRALRLLGASSDTDLALGVRSGRWSGQGPDLARALVEQVAARLEVANPRYFTSSA